MKIATLIAASILFFPVGKLVAQQKKNFFCSWKKMGVLPSIGNSKENRGIAGPVTGIIKDRLIVAGGCYFPDLMPWEGGHKIYTDKGYVFTSDSKDSLQVETIFQLPHSLSYPAICGTDKGLIIAGGENEQGISKKTWLLLYDPAKSKVSFESLPDLPFALANAAALWADGKVFLAGGEDQTQASSSLLMLDLSAISKGWQSMASIPHRVSHAVLGLTIRSGQPVLLLAGGRCKTPGAITPFYKEVYYYDCNNNQWSPAPSLPYEIAAGTGLSLPDGSFVLLGGDRGTTFHRVEEMLLEISKSTDAAVIDSLNKKKAVLQSSHPGFSREVLLLTKKADKWVAAGDLPFQTAVTTGALYWNNKIVLPAGEIRAGVRRADIYVGALSKKKHE